MRPGQGRGPRPGQGLGPADLGQARHPLPLQPDRLRRGGHPRAGQDGRRRPRAGSAPAGCACSASATTRATSPGSRSRSRSCPGWRPAEVRGELVPAFRALGFKYVTLDLEGFRSGSLNALIPLDSSDDRPARRPAPDPGSDPTPLDPRNGTAPMPRATCRCGQSLERPRRRDRAGRLPELRGQGPGPPAGREPVGAGGDGGGGVHPVQLPVRPSAQGRAAAGAKPVARQVPRLRPGRPRPRDRARSPRRATPRRPTEELTDRRPRRARPLDRAATSTRGRPRPPAAPPLLPTSPAPYPTEAGLRVCPGCGKPVHLGADVCRECGTKVPCC